MTVSENMVLAGCRAIGWEPTQMARDMLRAAFAAMFAASGTEARRAETTTEIGGSVHDGPTGVAGDAHTSSSSEQPQ